VFIDLSHENGAIYYTWFEKLENHDIGFGIGKLVYHLSKHTKI
jgi:hypothetical protein